MFKKLSFFCSALLLSNITFGDFMSAERAYENNQYTEAFNEFYKLAKQGEVRAQYYVGKMYLDGLGTNKDEKKGLDYIQKSADKKYDSAQTLLAFLYEEGRLIPKNKVKAIELYQEAAAAGNYYAKVNLGLAYYQGDGVGKDNNKAIQLLLGVPVDSIPEVGRYLGEIYLAQNEGKKATEAYRDSARVGDVESFYSLGKLYFNTSNFDSAKEYYTYAASQGNIPAQYLLGMMYLNGNGIEKDQAQGYAWIKMAADKNYSPAIEVKETLDNEMSRSEANKAQAEFLRIQNEVMGKVDSPFIAEQKRIDAANEAAIITAQQNGGQRHIRRRRR